MSQLRFLVKNREGLTDLQRLTGRDTGGEVISDALATNVYLAKEIILERNAMYIGKDKKTARPYAVLGFRSTVNPPDAKPADAAFGIDILKTPTAPGELTAKFNFSIDDDHAQVFALRKLTWAPSRADTIAHALSVYQDLAQRVIAGAEKIFIGPDLKTATERRINLFEKAKARKTLSPPKIG